MEYLMLIYNAEGDWTKMTPAEQAALSQEYGHFTQEIIQNGKCVVTDGPFAETKEQLAGYYLVNAKDLDEAIALAARIPGARHGSIEVRPIVVREQAKPA